MSIIHILVCIGLTAVVAYCLFLAYNHTAKMPVLPGAASPTPWFVWIVQFIEIVIAIAVILAIWGLGGGIDLSQRIG